MSKSYNIDNWFKKHKIWSGILIFIVLAVLISPFTTEEDNKNSNSSTSDVSQPANAAPLNNVAAEDATQPEKKSEPEIPAEYKSALNKAKSYADTMNMSKRGVYDQLVSEFGEKFTPEAAQYAIDNLVADWNANALAKAKTYQNEMSMSPAAIRDQLVSEYGEKFTEAEADYAIQSLNN